jgi:hypothetical protein
MIHVTILQKVSENGKMICFENVTWELDLETHLKYFDDAEEKILTLI